jgi:hypothetical protein
MDTPDARLAVVAAGQHALATRRQAHEAGLTDRMIRTRAAAGRLLAPAPGVLLLPGAPPTDGAIADLDFAYPQDRVGIEVDGHLGHATRRQRRNDYRRSNQVVIDDRRMLRFEYTDVTQRGDYVVETIRAALAGSRVRK